MDTNPRATLLKLIVEYATITLPIVIYVGLEAYHAKSFSHVLISPEWSIATIFLTLQTIRIFLDELHDFPGRMMTYLLLLVLVILTLIAVLNIHAGFDAGNSPGMFTLLVKWGLLAIASLIFVFFAGAAFYTSAQKNDGANS